MTGNGNFYRKSPSFVLGFAFSVFLKAHILMILLLLQKVVDSHKFKLIDNPEGMN